MLRSFFVLFSCCVVLCVGYAYNSECGPNEEPDWVQPCPPERTCKNRDIRFSCLDVETDSENRCLCKDGLIRNDEGDCIPEEQCEQNCTGENEEYTNCKGPCQPETCSTIGAQFKCNATEPEPCKEACVCKPGFLREDDVSPCIPMCQCPEMKNSQDCSTDKQNEV